MRRFRLLLATPIAVVLFASAFTRLAELKGLYQIEVGVNDQTYSGTFTVTPGQNGQFSAEMSLTSPSTVTGSFKGNTKGDSVFYTGTYNDQSRNCTGTMSSHAVMEKDGNVAGTLSINDSCAGGVDATLRLSKK